ncbi:PREDICTED: uncharacterized protein LOC105359552 [Ceratosolen solmsi marchali]|uniref:Uncharacterized protein LOC105359552 n=1 Tax=Ceratosolen solmsi marchali TaxID=326594 RepID=A0AAJ6VLA7_9HYME|nr:PREDICTED: uncharacterized protein LOC105359552 [Ceratosolen solmsi marchali]
MKILSIVNKQVMHLDSGQVINLIKMFHLMEVPSSSIIMQSLIQSIRLSINFLNLHEVYILTRLMNKMEPTHLSHAVRLALIEMFKVQVHLQLNTERIQELKSALIYATTYVNDESVLEFIIEAIESNKSPIDLNSSVILLLRLLIILLDNYGVMTIFNNLCIQILKGNNESYNSRLIDAIVNVSVVHNYGLQKWLTILNLLNRIRHVNIQLLEHLLNYFYENPSVFAKFHPTSCSLIMSGLAHANYKPLHWNELQNLLVNYVWVPDNTSLYSFVIDLAALDYYNSNILQKVFTDCSTTKVLSGNSCRLLYRLYHSVKALCPIYSGPWFSNETIHFLNNWKNQKSHQLLKSTHLNLPILPALEEFLGGSVYVRNNIIINELEEPIDHLILLQDEHPIDMESILVNDASKSFYNLEDFVIPSNSKRVAIVLIKSKTQSRNLLTLQPLDLLRIKILEAMSFKVIPIFENIWTNMSDYNRVLYLQSLIKIQKKEILR